MYKQEFQSDCTSYILADRLIFYFWKRTDHKYNQYIKNIYITINDIVYDSGQTAGSIKAVTSWFKS